MGIFMITISQMSSHTVAGVYPPDLAGHRGLDFPLQELTPSFVVLRHLEGCPRLLAVDAARARNAHRQSGGDLVQLRVRALVDADPAGPGNRLDPRIGQGLSTGVSTEDVEPRVEEPAVVEPADRSAAPRPRPLTRGVDAAVTRIDVATAAIEEREALREHTDALDH